MEYAKEMRTRREYLHLIFKKIVKAREGKKKERKRGGCKERKKYLHTNVNKHA